MKKMLTLPKFFKLPNPLSAPLALTRCMASSRPFRLGGQFEAENLQIALAPEHLHMLALIDRPPVLSFNDLVRRVYGDAGVNMVNKQP